MHPLILFLLWFVVGALLIPLYWAIIYWDDGKIEIKGSNVPMMLVGVILGPINILFLCFMLGMVTYSRYEKTTLFKMDRKERKKNTTTELRGHNG